MMTVSTAHSIEGHSRLLLLSSLPHFMPLLFEPSLPDLVNMHSSMLETAGELQQHALSQE